jgi:hypothetical protein
LSIVFTPFSKASLSTSLKRHAQYFIKAQAWQIIKTGFDRSFPSKHVLFRGFQIAQHTAAIPIAWNCFPVGIQTSHQFQHCSKVYIMKHRKSTHEKLMSRSSPTTNFVNGSR